jgi:hypothetical protein
MVHPCVIRRDEELSMNKQCGSEAMNQEEYVRKVLAIYRSTPGTTGSVRRPDRLLAVQLHQRGIPVDRIENALALAAVRRHIRPTDAPPLTTVRSLAYFLPVIEEVLQMQVGDDYFKYIRQKIGRLRAS